MISLIKNRFIFQKENSAIQVVAYFFVFLNGKNKEYVFEIAKKDVSLQRFRRKVLHFRIDIRAFSSAGSEHLPYKQRVGGSNPSTPTIGKADRRHRKDKPYKINVL